jgi:hypothetical protein
MPKLPDPSLALGAAITHQIRRARRQSLTDRLESALILAGAPSHVRLYLAAKAPKPVQDWLVQRLESIDWAPDDDQDADDQGEADDDQGGAS